MEMAKLGDEGAAVEKHREICIASESKRAVLHRHRDAPIRMEPAEYCCEGKCIGRARRGEDVICVAWEERGDELNGIG